MGLNMVAGHFPEKMVLRLGAEVSLEESMAYILGTIPTHVCGNIIVSYEGRE